MADRVLYDAKSNTPFQRDISFKFLVDAGNAPTLLTAANSSGVPFNLGITSVSRVSQGVYRLTLADNWKAHVATSAELNVNAAAAAWVQPGPIANFGNTTNASPTVDILVLNNASAVTDPPAQASNNVFISGVVSVCDNAGV